MFKGTLNKLAIGTKGLIKAGEEKLTEMEEKHTQECIQHLRERGYTVTKNDVDTVQP